MSKLNFDTTEIEGLNSTIKESRESVAQTFNEIKEAQNKIDNAYINIANGTATLDNAKKLEDKLDEMKIDVVRKQKVVQSLLNAKNERAGELETEIDTATKEAFEALQKDYEDVYESRIIPARLAYLEALASAGKVNEEAKVINAEMESLRSLVGADTSKSYHKRRALNSRSLNTSYFLTGKTEASGYGISETTLMKVHNNGVIPNEFL